MLDYNCEACTGLDLPSPSFAGSRLPRPTRRNWIEISNESLIVSLAIPSGTTDGRGSSLRLGLASVSSRAISTWPKWGEVRTEQHFARPVRFRSADAIARDRTLSCTSETGKIIPLPSRIQIPPDEAALTVTVNDTEA